MKTHTKFSSSSQREKSAAGFSLRGFEVLSLVTEERAIRLDLAARILNMKPVVLAPIVDRLVEQGLMEQERFLVKERYPWMWPTRSGLRVPGTEYPFYVPTLGHLQHMAGVAVTRSVCIEANPGALWVSERALMREQSRCKRHLADGALEVDGKRIPVEVELTSKDRYKVASIMGALLDGFGAAHYYCSRQTRGAVEETIRSKGFTNVEVFDVPSFA
jgi:hypothetical protein